MYVLIDTNIFVSLITNQREEYLLDQLEKIAESNLVTLLVPNNLLQEWEKISQKTIKDFRSKYIELDVLDFDHHLKRIESIVTRISSLLKSGQKLRSNKNIRDEIGKRMEKSLPPFHG